VTKIQVEPDELLAVLSGEPVAGLVVRGDAGRLASVREWIKRAQSE